MSPTTRRAVEALGGLRLLRGPLFKAVLLLAPALFIELGVADRPSSPGRLWLVLGQFALYLAFAYAVNDLADRDADRRAGKQRTLGELPRASGLAVTSGLGLGTLVLAAALRPPPLYGVWLALGLALAVGYSAPPLWLKRRGALGVVVGPVLGKTVPLLLCCTLWQRWGWWAVLIGAADLVKNAVDLLFHQLVDEEADRGAGIRTYVVAAGAARARRMLGWFARAGSIAAVAVAALAAWRIPELRWPLMAALPLVPVAMHILHRRTTAAEPASPRAALPAPYVVLGGAVFLLGPAVLAVVLAWRHAVHTPFACLVLLVSALQLRFYWSYRYR